MTRVGLITYEVETAYDRLEGRRQMLKVSEDVLTQRTESNRAPQHELLLGSALNLQADMPTAQKYDANALRHESQYDYFEARPEVIHAIGGTVR